MAFFHQEESQNSTSLHTSQIPKKRSKEEGLTVTTPRLGASVIKSILKMKSDDWEKIDGCSDYYASFDTLMTRRVSFAVTASVLHYDVKDDVKKETCLVKPEHDYPMKIAKQISSSSYDSLGSRMTSMSEYSTKSNRLTIASDYMSPASMEFIELFGCSTGGSPQYDPIVTSSRRRSVHSSKLMEEREPMGTTPTTAAYTTKQAKKGMSQEEDQLSFYGKK